MAFLHSVSSKPTPSGEENATHLPPLNYSYSKLTILTVPDEAHRCSCIATRRETAVGIVLKTTCHDDAEDKEQ